MTIPAITIQDTGSSSTTGQGGQAIITGTPTAASTVGAFIQGSGTAGLTISGTWTGTLSFEQSSDGGITYVPTDAMLDGVDSVLQSCTGNGVYKIAAAANSIVRVRATAAMTGSAAVNWLGAVVTDFQHVVVLNASNITIGNVGGKAASGASKSGNPVLVGGAFNTTQPTVTNGQAVDAQATARGAMIVAAGIDGLIVNQAFNTVQTNPTVTAGAYTANWCVGGIQTLTAAMRNANGTGQLDSIDVIDAAAQGAELTFLFFKALPSGGTYADGGALVLAAGDMAKFIGATTILAANYLAAGTGVKAVGLNAIGMDVKGDASGNIYVICVTTGTPTYTALCLTLNYGFKQG